MVDEKFIIHKYLKFKNGVVSLYLNMHGVRNDFVTLIIS